MKTSAQRIQTADTIELVPQILSLKKILVPIDFSDMSKHAFQYALRFAEQFRCKIVLLHVVEPETVIAGTSLAVDVFAQLEDDMTAAKAELAALAASSRDRLNSVALAVRTGHAPNEITKAARDLDVDLIMIATTAIPVGGICASAARLSESCAPRRVQYSSSAKKNTSSFNQVQRSSCEKQVAKRSPSVPSLFQGISRNVRSPGRGTQRFWQRNLMPRCVSSMRCIRIQITCSLTGPAFVFPGWPKP